MPGVMSGVVNGLGMREADTDYQEGPDKQAENGGDHGFGTRDLGLLDVLVLH